MFSLHLICTSVTLDPYMSSKHIQVDTLPASKMPFEWDLAYWLIVTQDCMLSGCFIEVITRKNVCFVRLKHSMHILIIKEVQRLYRTTFAR